MTLCPGFNDGTCIESGQYKECTKDPNLKHQCSRCLSQYHGAGSPDCPGSPMPQPGKGKGSKGGKGKGKKGGGKGKSW